MRRCRVLVAATRAAVWGTAVLAAAGAAYGGAVPAASAASPAAGSWGRAIQVPGLVALSTGGQARVVSLSCASAGNCAAGGAYRDGAGHVQGFVAVEQNGRWGRAIEVPGLGALNTGGIAEVSSVSCASAGNCAAGGYYRQRHFHAQGFVAAERNGRWGRAIEVPGLGALNTGGYAFTWSVSCASAGSCAAGGYYSNRHLAAHGFVALERNGRWGRAIEVPGLAALSPGGGSEVTSVSCGSAGNCAAGGSYPDRSGFGRDGFVADERHGVWGKALEVPGLAALNTGGNASLLSVSCGSAGNCAAGGWYTDRTGADGGFVADERHGVWGKAIEVPGLGTLNKNGGETLVASVSCGSAGTCAAGGHYSDRDGNFQGFVAIERDGVWGKAIEVPGLGTLNTGGSAYASSVSCGSAGTCAAGGYYSDRRGNLHGFVADERDGIWARAIQVPGLATLNKANAGVNSVSCPPAGRCAAGGYYAIRLGHQQGFVTR